jgi:hypothetical protein
MIFFLEHGAAAAPPAHLGRDKDTWIHAQQPDVSFLLPAASIPTRMLNHTGIVWK